MLQGWAFARWLRRSLTLKENQSSLTGMMSSLHRAEFGPDFRNSGSEIVASWGLKRRSDSPMRPPVGQIQAPPLEQGPKHFLATSSSPPDTDSNRSGNSVRIFLVVFFLLMSESNGELQCMSQTISDFCSRRTRAPSDPTPREQAQRNLRWQSSLAKRLARKALDCGEHLEIYRVQPRI